MPGEVKPSTRATVELAAEWEKSSFTRILKQLKDIEKEHRQLKFTVDDMDVAKAWSKQLKTAADDVADTFGGGLITRFDRQATKLLNSLADNRERMVDATSKGDAAMVKDMKTQEAVLEANLKMMTASYDEQAKRIEKLRENWEPNFKNMQDAGETIGTQLTTTLNHLKSGDIVGFGKAVAGGVSKGLSATGAKFDLSAAATDGAGLATSFEAMGAFATATAAGIMLVAGAVAAVVAVMVEADSQAKDMNKSLLDGVGMADFAFSKAGNVGVELTATMSDAQDASLRMAHQFRGDAKEYAGVLAELDKAGLTYQEMAKNEKGAADAATALADNIKTVVVWSKALGISSAETAEVMNQWSSDFGMGLDEINDRFAQVAEMAGRSAMGSKRFFGAITQATAGMALYNNRMDEAAGLLLQTSKILGDTDASDFIKSLTKGFADESYVDRFKRIMISGVEDVRKVMQTDSLKMAKNFGKTFADNTNVQAAFGDMKVSLLQDPKEMIKFLGGKSEKETRKIVQTLHDSGEDAAARQVESMSEIARDQKGGVTEMAKGLGELSMGGKLAVKLQGLGNKRISEMSGIELAAYEQYSGIGGEQLEQMRRIDRGIMGQYDEITDLREQAKKGEKIDQAKLDRLGVAVGANGDLVYKGTTDAVGDLNDYTVHYGEVNAKELEDAGKIQDKATAFAQSSVDNTTSIFSLLKTGIQVVLKDIYDIMVTFYNAYEGIGPEVLKTQQRLLDENSKQQESAQSTLSELEKQLDDLNRQSRQTGDPKVQADLAEKIQQTTKAIDATQSDLDKTRAAGSDIAAGRTNATNNATLGVARASDIGNMHGGGALLTADFLTDWVSNAVSPDLYKGSADAVNMATAQGKGPVGGATGALTTAAVEANSTVGPVVAAAGAAKDEGVDLLDDAATTLDDQTGILSDTQVLGKKGFTIAKKFYDTKFSKDNLDSTLDAMKNYDAWKLASSLNLTGDDITSAMAEYSSGATAAGHGILAHALAGGSEAAQGLATGMGLTPKAQDFVMRPGQPAQRFSAGDTVIGAKEGGPLAGAMGGGGGGMVNIHIHGGDQAKIYQTVKDAIKSSGLRPGR